MMNIWLCAFLTACTSISREKLSKMHFTIESYHSFTKKSRLHRCANRRAQGSRGGGGPRQDHHFNALLPSHVALARHTSEMILNIVCY